MRIFFLVKQEALCPTVQVKISNKAMWFCKTFRPCWIRCAYYYYRWRWLCRYRRPGCIHLCTEYSLFQAHGSLDSSPHICKMQQENHTVSVKKKKICKQHPLHHKSKWETLTSCFFMDEWSKAINLGHHDINMYEGIGWPRLAHWTLLAAPLILSNRYDAHILTRSDIKPENTDIIWWEWAYGIENVELNLAAWDRKLVCRIIIQ